MNCLYVSSTRTFYNGYSKMEVEEEEEEMRHRKAQFLIYKSMKKVDSLTQRRRRPSQPSIWLIKLRGFGCRVKIKIGNRLIMRLRKTISAAAYKQVFLHFKTLRRLLRRRGGGGEGEATVVNVVPQQFIK